MNKSKYVMRQSPCRQGTFIIIYYYCQYFICLKIKTFSLNICSEYCGNENKNIDMTQEEIPKDDRFDYMLSPPRSTVDDASDAEKPAALEKKPGIIIYCMDISGSMTCQVQGSEMQGNIIDLMLHDLATFICACMYK